MDVTTPDPVELSLKTKIEILLDLRRQFLKADADRDRIRKAGTEVHQAFIKEFRTSLKPGRGKARTKTVRAKDSNNESNGRQN